MTGRKTAPKPEPPGSQAGYDTEYKRCTATNQSDDRLLTFLQLVVKTSNQMLSDNEVDARQADREEETGFEE